MLAVIAPLLGSERTTEAGSHFPGSTHKALRAPFFTDRSGSVLQREGQPMGT
jgi:hypothetical protein